MIEDLAAVIDGLAGVDPQALAVQVRDRECFHDYCDLPADQCQVDHIRPWTADGPTIQANGRPACGYHNRQRHQRRDDDSNYRDSDSDDPP